MVDFDGGKFLGKWKMIGFKCVGEWTFVQDCIEFNDVLNYHFLYIHFFFTLSFDELDGILDFLFIYYLYFYLLGEDNWEMKNEEGGKQKGKISKEWKEMEGEWNEEGNEEG